MEDIYSWGKGRDESFGKKNFIIHYKSLIDIPLYKSDKKKFIEKLKCAEDLVKDIDVNKSLLFMCKKGISKYVFLESMSKLDRIVSFKFLNLVQIVDIWNGNARSDNCRIDIEDTYVSDQNLIEDVLCVYIDKSMTSVYNYQKKILSSILSSRSEKVNRRGERLITWVYFQGERSDLADGMLLENMRDFFSTADKDLFKVIDLNSTSNDVKVKVGDIY